MTEIESVLVKWLASESLKYKWIREQEKNINRLLQPCSFCTDSNSDEDVENKSELVCSNCLCPKDLCADDGQKGLIGFIARKYKNGGGNSLVKNIDPNLYKLVRTCLLDIHFTGKISDRVKNNIRLLKQ